MKQGWNDVSGLMEQLRANLRPFMSIHISVTLLVIAVLSPLSALLLRLSVLLSGDSALSDQDILFFILRPGGFTAFVVLVSIFSIIVFLEYAAMIMVAWLVERGRDVSVPGVLKFLASHAGRLFRLAAWILLRVLLYSAPFAALLGGIYLLLLTDYDINYYLFNKPAEWYMALGLAAVVLPAAVARVGAAWCKAAARGRIDQVRWTPGNRGQSRVLGLGDARDRSQETLRVGVAQGRKEFSRRGYFHDAAGIHHGDFIAAAGHHAEVVGHQDHRHVAVALLLGKQVEDLVLHRDIERRGRLVRQQQAGTARQCHGNTHTLAHAPGHFVGEAVEARRRFRNVHGAHQLNRGSCRLRFAKAQVTANVLRKLATDLDHGVERGHGVLEHHRNLGAPQSLQVFRGPAEKLLAGVANRAGRMCVARGGEAHDGAAQDSLSRPGFTDNAQGLSFLKTEGYAVHSPHLTRR